jgi:hypothetical protein
MTQLRGPGQLNSLEFDKITVMRGLAMPGKLHSALDLASPSRSVTAAMFAMEEVFCWSAGHSYLNLLRFGTGCKQ